MRPRKDEVQQRIEEAPIKGDIRQSESLGIDYVHDCNDDRVGTFEGKKYYSAQVVINVYVANILRQHERVAIIRRDVQFHYADNKKACYQCCVNPLQEECFDSDEYEVALAAKSDGNGNFEYFLYDDTIMGEYQKSCSRSKGVRQKEDIQGILEFLQQFNIIYRIRLTEDTTDKLRGADNSGNVKTDLSAYEDFVVLNKERTEAEGKGQIEFYTPKTVRYYNDEKDFETLNEQIKRLEEVLKRNKAKRRRLAQKLGIVLD